MRIDFLCYRPYERLDKHIKPFLKTLKWKEVSAWTMVNKKLSSKCFYCIDALTTKTTPETNIFRSMKQKKAVSWETIFFLLFKSGFQFGVQVLFKWKKKPKEHSILNVGKTSVVVPIWHVSITWKENCR